MRPLGQLEEQARAEHVEAKRQHEIDKQIADADEKKTKKEMDQAAKDDKRERVAYLAAILADTAPEAPTRTRFKSSDATVEKLGELLNENPRGLLLFRDELTGWLKSLDREDKEKDRAFFLEAWNGGNSFTFDRIGRGTVDIQATCISLLGGIQPGPLSDYLRQVAKGGGHDDGLLQRIQLAVWPDIAATWQHVDRAPNREARNRAQKVFDRLAALDPTTVGAVVPEEGPPYLRFADEAQKVFIDWRTELEHRIRAGEEPSILEAHLAKYRSLVPSLALLIHLADNGAGPVSMAATSRALAWIEYLETHARRIYSPVTQPTNQAAHALAHKLQEGALPERFTARDLYRRHWQGLDTKEAVHDALDMLEDLGWLAAKEEATGGRPRVWYWLNPKIKGGTASG